MEEQFEFIINNWTDLYIGILIYQQSHFRHIAENINNKIDKLVNRKSYILESHLLKLTKVFNDAIYQRYGLDYLLEGIRMMTGIDIYGNSEEYKKLIIFDVKDGVVPKGILKEVNRKSVMKEISNEGNQ